MTKTKEAKSQDHGADDVTKGMQQTPSRTPVSRKPDPVAVKPLIGSAASNATTASSRAAWRSDGRTSGATSAAPERPANLPPKSVLSGTRPTAATVTAATTAPSRPAPPPPGFLTRGPIRSSRDELNDMQVTDHFSDPDDSDDGHGTHHQPLSRHASMTKDLPGLPTTAATPISVTDSLALQRLLWGSSQRPTRAWLDARLTLGSHPLAYGIVQEKGGPCGVLAAIQGRLIAVLQKQSKGTTGTSRWTEEVCRHALVEAVAGMLWDAKGDKTRVLVAVPSSPLMSTPSTTPLPLIIHALPTLPSVLLFLPRHLPNLPLLPVVYSLLLTRTVKTTVSDMDDPTQPLVGAHGYCTQDLVNLCLTGQASSNVFDGVTTVDHDGTTTLKGIQRDGLEVGFLSLFESYGSLEVGSRYKDPVLPIWVVHSESHYTVLFSADGKKPSRSKGGFEMVYYDGLAGQEEEVRVRIIEGRGVVDPDGMAKSGSALIPPLERCVRTRWKGAEVEWIGCDPIL
ncbi:hypothetical protein HKX48_006114 [Thoreauomyces humboldtii]|nr:hypothetical protein HKX48_006114 [Thoreauomyces humboldtii]